MENVKLYRKRIIPQECVYLKDDIILYQDSEVIITRWNTLHPKKTLHHGYSCYFLERGFKVSKFYDHDSQLISWYCDIISTSYDIKENSYIFTDLLIDVIVYPDGFVRVVDLDELADAFRDRLLTNDELQMALRRLDKLLSLIYKGAFSACKNISRTMIPPMCWMAEYFFCGAFLKYKNTSKYRQMMFYLFLCLL